ncbi:S16 family serine protease [Escherichia coli]
MVECRYCDAHRAGFLPDPVTRLRADVAMTGEITRVVRYVPIGGLKEKLLQRIAAGLKQC